MKTARLIKDLRANGEVEYRFKLFSANGEEIAISSRDDKQTYTQKHSAIDTLKNNFPDYTIVDETGESTHEN